MVTEGRILTASDVVSGNPVRTVQVSTTANDEGSPSAKDQQVMAVGDPTTPANLLKVNSGGDIPISISNPNSVAAGIYATIAATGALNVQIDGTILFADEFETGTVDVTNRWTASGTVPATQSGGALLVNPAATASATSVLNSQPTFPSYSTNLFGTVIAIEAAVTLGNHRFWGIGTPPSVPGTSAAPLQDAVGFEVDTAGALRASVYAAGTRVATQTLTRPTDAANHRYSVVVRGDVAFWYLDTFDVPVFSSLIGPSVQLLPVRLASLNSASVTVGTPTMSVNGVGLFDQGRNATQIADGTLPHRKWKIDALGNASVGLTSSPLTEVTGSATATGVIFTQDCTNYQSVRLQLAAPVAWSGVVVQFEVSNDNTNWQGVLLSQTSSVGVGATNVSFAGLFSGNVGAKYFRVRVSSYTSGTIAVTAEFGAQSHPYAGMGVTANNFTTNVTLADAFTNPATGHVAADNMTFNGTTWDRARGNATTTTGDTGAKTATFNGATQTNFNGRGIVVVLNIGTVTGTTPTLVAKMQGSADGGTTWYDIPGAVTASLVATGVFAITVYPGATVLAGSTTTGTTAVASNTVPRTWRMVYTIGGTTPSFTLTNVQVSTQV